MVAMVRVSSSFEEFGLAADNALAHRLIRKTSPNNKIHFLISAAMCIARPSTIDETKV